MCAVGVLRARNDKIHRRTRALYRRHSSPDLASIICASIRMEIEDDAGDERHEPDERLPWERDHAPNDLTPRPAPTFLEHASAGGGAAG